MAMGVNEARHQHQASGVHDFFRFFHRGSFAEKADLAAGDPDKGVGQDAQVRIHGQDRCAGN